MNDYSFSVPDGIKDEMRDMRSAIEQLTSSALDASVRNKESLIFGELSKRVDGFDLEAFDKSRLSAIRRTGGDRTVYCLDGKPFMEIVDLDISNDGDRMVFNQKYRVIDDE